MSRLGGSPIRRGLRYMVPGVQPGDQASVEVWAWAGDFDSWNAALAGGAPAAYSGTFWNPTGAAGSAPGLVNMPTNGMGALDTPPVVYAQMKIAVDQTNQVAITWQVGTLVSAPTVAGPFSPVPGATSPYVVSASATGPVFYRLMQ